MSIYDTSAVKVYDNDVIEILFEDQLATHLALEQFAHADYSLTEDAGMLKKIRRYFGTGNVEKLAMGEGNTGVIGADFTEEEYRVLTTQGKGVYYDEAAMADPAAIEKLVNHMAVVMVNDLRGSIVAEAGKTSNKLYGQTFNFDCVADAIATLPDELTENEGLFLLVNRKDVALWRKNLKDDLKYVEAFVRKGYVGHVCGVPMYWSDAVAQGKAFLGTSEAVTIFVKKGTETEQERDADHRKNTLFIRKVDLVALTNEGKMIEIRSAADPRTGYTALAEQPADWATDYNDYYTFDAKAGAMVKNAFEAAPEFVANKFFSKN